MPDYKVITPTRIYKYNPTKDRWGFGVEVDRGEVLRDLTDETIDVNGVTLRLFKSEIDAIADNCIEQVDAPILPPIVNADAVVSGWFDWEYGSWGECISGIRQRSKTRRRVIVTPALGNGITPHLIEKESQGEDCDTTTPPPVVKTLTATVLVGDLPINDRPDYNEANRIRTAIKGETFVVDALPTEGDGDWWYRIAAGPETGHWLMVQAKAWVTLR